ncbi:MAG TPA: hypothetical protein VED40_23090 [Azospirillaceae bacterium]|nr:hypothetical protein [Azospirillaceae bacterium]
MLASARELFDVYSRKARLQPALLTLFPMFITVAVHFPGLYTFGAGLIGLAVTCGVTVWLADVARSRGRMFERRLQVKLGGKQTAIWLRHRDESLDPGTKEHYCAFLASRIPGWQMPTAEEEAADPKRADGNYDRAVAWLIEYTRDTKTYPLIFKELIVYGFRRNMMGMRPLGIFVGAISIAFNAAVLWWPSLVPNIDIAKSVAALALSALALIGWIVTVTEEAVIDASRCYAKQLLAVCLGDAQGPVVSKKKSRKTAAAAE